MDLLETLVVEDQFEIGKMQCLLSLLGWWVSVEVADSLRRHVEATDQLHFEEPPWNWVYTMLRELKVMIVDEVESSLSSQPRPAVSPSTYFVRETSVQIEDVPTAAPNCFGSMEAVDDLGTSQSDSLPKGSQRRYEAVVPAQEPW